MAKVRVRFSIESQELKDAITEYGKCRGFTNIGDLSRCALFEYIRRRSPKDAPAVLHRFLT